VLLARLRRAVRRDPGRFQKLTFSYRQRMDFPTRAGLGRTRNDVYESLNQNTRSKDVRGYVVGSALVCNHYWGISASHDEYVKTGPSDRFHHQTTVLGLGYSPLGKNQGRIWNYSVDPAVSFEKFHGLEPVAGVRYESFGYSIGPNFYYGLDWIRLGRQTWFTLDRFKVGTAISDSEIAKFAVSAGVNLTAYATRYLKLSLGVNDAYTPHDGKHQLNLKTGLSVRLVWADWHF
ncbi:MAG TPA: hypothetical protein P5079_09095, partial [Elusimicrobiota bacterium]|nr:hypothetical protein [Elusimicrobiota bacterium]